MNTIDCIKTRRSIRKFLSDPIPRETVEKLIGLAAWAPSWKNSQTTRYIALTGEEKASFAENAVGGRNQSFIDGAPLLLALCTIKGVSGVRNDRLAAGGLPESHWQSFDCGIACQTLCLAAHELGLGTVIMGIYDSGKAHEFLSLPESMQVSALVAVGKPDEAPDPRPRKDTNELLTWFHE